jgi:hypothetical protein
MGENITLDSREETVAGRHSVYTKAFTSSQALDFVNNH